MVCYTTGYLDRYPNGITHSILGTTVRFNLFPDPIGHFGLSGQSGVAGGAALQAVSECPRRR